MTVDRRTPWLMIALGAIATLGVCAELSAQVPPKPRPDTAAKVGQRSGEVALAPCLINEDSIDREIKRQVKAAEYRASRRTIDSIVSAERLERQRAARRGSYAGFAGGVNVPLGETRASYLSAPTLSMPFGWDATDLPVGVRADLGFADLGGHSLRDPAAVVVSNNGDVQVYSLTVDAKARLQAPGALSRTHLYGLAGLGAHRLTGRLAGIIDTAATNFTDANTRWGWNAGMGAAFSWSHVELFVEARYVGIWTNLPYASSSGVGRYMRMMPISVGYQRF